MCGIAGYLGSKNIENKFILQTMNLMKRRGPNGQKYKHMLAGSNKNCYLLHSRLSIIDLDERSDQPFVFKDKTLVYNGEIYNYLEVKEQLVKLGHKFTTKSDTEVLIHAIDEWGIKEALNTIEGMWSFAYFDNTNKALTIARDPFGEKPLYIYEPEPGEIYFGSEIKFIASLANRKFAINYNYLQRFLVNGYKAIFKTNDTFFSQVYHFPKSSVCLIENDQNIRYKYWQPIIKTNSDMSFDDAVYKTRELLIDSVKNRLRADIPIAFCMSGGVDSNSLLSIAKRVFNYDVHGFTIVNSDSRYEEQEMIDCGVQELSIKHSAYPISDRDFLVNLRKLINYHDAPVITISFYLNWLLQEKIAQHNYHISISGTAADELFSGYFDHQLLYLYDIKNDKNLLKESIENWYRDTAPVVRSPLLQDPYVFINDPFFRKHSSLNCEKYSSYLKNYWHEPFSEKYYRDGLLQNRMINELFEETTPISLHEDDLNAMYYSIENRAPFLDRKLFEFCHSIPAKYLIKNGAAKAVLREAMRGIVPDKILNSKKKVGFNAPITDLLKFTDKKIRSFMFEDSPIWDIFDRNKFKKIIESSYLPNSDSKFLFSFVSSKIFLEEFL